MAIREIEPGRLWVNERFEEALRGAGLLSFEGLYNAQGTPATRERPGKRRTVVKIEMTEGGKKRAFYLKQHEGTSLMGRMAARLAGRKSPARQEWDNIHRLGELGIATMTPVALGEDPATGRSLTVTKGLAGGMPLDEYVRHLGAEERRQLAVRLGGMVRKLHGARLTHKDLYLCHVFAMKETGKETGLHLIDLQRVGERKWWLERWRVKDVAQLEYSRPKGVTRTDCIRFLIAYLEKESLGPEEKAFVKAVLKKTESIRRHDMKMNGGQA